MSWRKIDPEGLPNAVTCYLDVTVALPLITAYALAKHPPRRHKRLYDQRDALLEQLRREYEIARPAGIYE